MTGVLSPNTLLVDVDFCVIDTETTGGSAHLQSVIDVAVLRFRGGEVVEKYETLINPGRPIPLWISNLTGIQDDMVARAPRFADIAERLKAILQKGIFTAHNAPFDFSFIHHEYLRLGILFNEPRLCTVRLARVLYPELPSRSLGALCENFMIDIWDRHRAMGDAEATVTVLKNMLRDLERHHQVTTWGQLLGFMQTKKKKKKVTAMAPL